MLRQSAKNFASQLFGLAVSFIDRIFLVGLLIRVWGPAGYSDWAALVAAAGLLGLADPGFQLFYGNRLTRAKLTGDQSAFDRTLGFGVIFYGALSLALVLFAGALALSVDLSALLNLTQLPQREAAIAFALIGAMVISRTARAELSQLYRGNGEFHRGIVTDTTTILLGVLAMLIAAASGATPVQLAATYFACDFFLGWLILGTDTFVRYRPRFEFRGVLASELPAFGAVAIWYALVQGLPIFLLHLPILMLSALGLGGAGLVSFVVQRTLVNFGRSFASMATMSTGLELANLVHRGAHEEMQRGAALLARLNAVFAGAMVAGLIVFGQAVITQWTGRPELFTLLTLMALAAPAVIGAAGAPLANLSLYADRPSAQAMALAVLATVGAYALGHAYGVAGVAIGVALGEVIGASVVLPFLAARRFGVPYGRILFSSLTISVLTAAVGVILGAAITAVLAPSDKARLLIDAALWSAMVVGPLALIAVGANTRQRAFAFLKKRLGRRA
jgi:hypothetical protein